MGVDFTLLFNQVHYIYVLNHFVSHLKRHLQDVHVSRFPKGQSQKGLKRIFYEHVQKVLFMNVLCVLFPKKGIRFILCIASQIRMQRM